MQVREEPRLRSPHEERGGDDHVEEVQQDERRGEGRVGRAFDATFRQVKTLGVKTIGSPLSMAMAPLSPGAEHSEAFTAAAVRGGFFAFGSE